MIFPILGGFVPIISLLPLSLVADVFYSLRPLRLFCSIGPCVLALYWVSLIFIKLRSVSFSMILNSSLCLFVFIPLLYILPQRKVYYFTGYDSISYVLMWTLLSIGMVVSISVLGFDAYLSIRRKYNRQQLKKRLAGEGRRQDILELEKAEDEEN